jgi:hypothetical protein
MSPLVHIPNARRPVAPCVCGRFAHASPYVPHRSPESRSSTKSSLRPLPPRPTYLGDIGLTCCRPSGCHGSQRGFVISIEQAHHNMYDGEGQPWGCVFQVRSSRVSLAHARVFSVLIFEGCSTTTMTTTVIISFMTFWRYLRLPEKWTRHGLGRIVLRDSALSLSAISGEEAFGVCRWSDADIDRSGMMLFMTLCSLQVIKPSMSGNITY